MRDQGGLADSDSSRLDSHYLRHQIEDLTTLLGDAESVMTAEERKKIERELAEAKAAAALGGGSNTWGEGRVSGEARLFAFRKQNRSRKYE